MCENIKIGVIGGDSRLCYLAEASAEKYETAVWGGGSCGSCVRCAGLEDAVKNADAIVLPIPVTRDGVRLFAPLSKEGENMRLTGIAALIEPKTIVFGGLIPADLSSALESRGITVLDYYETETVKIESALQTAEGALGIAISELHVTVRGAEMLVVGYGRVGRATADLLIRVGATVTVAARKPSDLAWAKASGCRVISDADGIFTDRRYNAVFNTVPARLFGKKELAKLGDALFVELASSPYGCSADDAKESGIRLIRAPSLPGKTSPKSAGLGIFDCICSALRESGVI